MDCLLHGNVFTLKPLAILHEKIAVFVKLVDRCYFTRYFFFVEINHEAILQTTTSVIGSRMNYHKKCTKFGILRELWLNLNSKIPIKMFTLISSSQQDKHTVRCVKCPYSEFFWSVFCNSTSPTLQYHPCLQDNHTTHASTLPTLTTVVHLAR